MSPRREPALYIGAVSAALSLLVAINFHGLSSEQAALIVAVITAIGGVATAVATRPVTPAAFTALVAAAAALLAGFHFNVDPGTVAAINGIVLAVLSLVTRHQVTPVTAPARLAR